LQKIKHAIANKAIIAGSSGLIGSKLLSILLHESYYDEVLILVRTALPVSHKKLVQLVIDFDKPDARVWLGSYNFSIPADTKNGENLLLIKDRRVVVSYTVEALRIFDHYHFRVAQKEAKTAKKKLQLAKPPRKAGEKPWFADDYSDKRKIRDRELFA